MVFSDLLDIMQQRAERLGLVDQDTGHADSSELLLYLFQALLDIVETVDVPAYTHTEPDFALTVSGVPKYPLPDDFGRLILPRVRNRRGIFLFDGYTNHDLEYLEPNAFTRQTSLTNSIPLQFSILQGFLWLFPTPDAAFTIKGTYIVKPERPELDSQVLLSYPAALIDVGLLRLAGDMGKDLQFLERMREESLGRLVKGSR